MEQYLDSITDSAGRIADALRTGPLDAPVRACPGWDLAELGRHIGYIHRWARVATLHGARPADDDIEAPPPADDLADWVEQGAAALNSVFAGLDPATPTWHPFPVAKVAAVWPRRQASETLIHAWDAQDAVGGSRSLDPLMASDGIAEYFEVIVPRIISRTDRVAPTGTIEVTSTDTGLRLVVVSDSTGVLLEPTATPEASLSGSATELALALWGRIALDEPPEHPLALGWLSFGGN
ncbi:MAG: maleylpyruvate isomerase family mycothiol-dependent enzyme [Ilumatobacteraceae bacterium]